MVVRYAFLTALVSLPAASLATDEPLALSDYFVVKKHSSGFGVFKGEVHEIFVRQPGKDLEYVGTTPGGPPGGMGPFTETTRDLRPITIAVSKDGRSVVFRTVTGVSKLEGGIYRYVYGEGRKLLRKQDELGGLSRTRWGKVFPADLLPFSFKPTYTPKDMEWAVKATGEEFPLALHEASPLHWAAFEGRTADCVMLIKEGANVDAKTYWDFTALDLALIRDREETALQLLSLGANPNLGIYPAFHRAVMLGRLKAVETMLQRGMNIGAGDEHGYTPIQLAMFAGSRKVGGLNIFFDYRQTADRPTTLRLVQLLMSKGADPTIRDKYGRNALDSINPTTPLDIRELLTRGTGAR